MEYKCKILTPMFLSGVNPSKPELRVPSFKGGIRFWWRALSRERDIEALKKREGLIFGSTSNRSRLLVRLEFDQAKLNGLIKPKPPSTKVKVHTFHKGKPQQNSKPKENFLLDFFRGKDQSAIKYITYGVEDQKFIAPSDDFEFTLKMKCPDIYRDEIDVAFKMMAHFGGVGGKARNGLGSFEIVGQNFDYQGFLREKINNSGEIKPYTAITSETQLFESRKQNYPTWNDALFSLALAYKKIKWQPPKQNRHSSNEQNTGRLNKDYRKYIGYMGEKDKKGNQIGIPGLERHSKSHFFNVIKNDNGTYKGVVLYVPYSYLSGIEMKNKISGEEVNSENIKYNTAQAEFNQILRDHSIFNRTL